MNWPLQDPVIITQGFGQNPQDYKKYGYPGHNGLDLWTPANPPLVLAIGSGIVEKVGYEAGGYGKYVVLRHTSPSPSVKGKEERTFYSYYCHLSAVHVAPGEPIDAGQPVAIMGSTGNSTGPHLHLGIRYPSSCNPSYKGYVDPLPLLNGAAQPTVAPVDSSSQSPPPSAFPGEGKGKTILLTGQYIRLPGSILIKAGKKKTIYRMRRYF